jgi:membrane protease YdiL (CAAX protease family)
VRNNSTWASSALSPIVWPERAWNPWGSAGAALATLVLNVIPGFFVVAGYLLYVRSTHGHLPSTPAQFPAIMLLFAQIVSYVPIVIFLVVVLPLLSRASLEELGIRKPTARDIGVGLAGTVAMWIAVVVSGAAAAAITHRHDTESAVAVLKDLKSPFELTVFFLLACVFAPIVEELTFRVLVFNALTKYASVLAAAIVSGALFGAEHALGQPLGQLITVALPLAFGGFVLAIVYATTRCFWSNVTTHACFNAINVVALVFFHVT